MWDIDHGHARGREADVIRIKDVNKEDLVFWRSPGRFHT